MIHEDYQAVAREFCSGRMLKTDCWNEAETDYPIAPLLPGVVCLELDPARVGRAKARHPGIYFRQGSITELPFADESFDRVFDFSTIDHLEDFRPALDEYRRVLAAGGLLVLVTWLTDGEIHSSATAWGGMQYFFPAGEFRSELEARFVVEREREFEDQRFGPYHLKLFVCRGNT